ncbi:NUDIX hydrolase [Pseudomonas palleroniana]|uniref:Isopentenyldiphosphate isomerase n=1 Tax=Pseudomonas palleroniana TaxID=191390 RepID=A0A1H5J7A6_9PSED|nr:NUDIX hydrolase [Pseudomonas palleroniana]KAB0566060.1 NUDIX hydrolase [Pseudomonas palleroniana]PTC27581.1 NUDIX hydrolase [Pseudomonas palleroniana]SEE48359.1 Isopentenyldiphosphate isomerase [Pseudomonas palleroniana]
MDATPNEAAHRAASDAELICWVDRQDNLLGHLVRSDLRQRGLIGRCTFIFLFNSAGLLCVHRRTLSKALYPGFWDTAAGGMVAAGESYAESAARELEEELGVAGAVLTECDHFFFEDGDSRLWCKSYSAVWDGPLRLQPEEVMEARFLPIETVLLEAEQTPYCPDAQEGLRRYLASRR